MSEIKLPVRVEEDENLFRENARSMWILCEDDGREIIRSAQQNALQRIAAALNAAPKRAFAELTVRELCAMMEGDEVSEEQLLFRLQSFAAPIAPAWREIENLPLPREFVYLQPKDRRILPVIAALREQEYQVAVEPTFECRDGHIYNLDYFTHWQPLPAAPETQGGREDE